MSDIIGEYVDRLITIEMKNRAMPHGIIHKLYDAARAEAGRPLTALAAEGIVKRVSKGDVVFIITGAGYPPVMPNGESDGPPGAAVMGRMLYYGLGAVPIYITEEKHAGPVIASSEAAGVMIRSFDEAKNRRLGGVSVTAPIRQTEVPNWTLEIFDRFQAKVVISTERLGPNEKGVIHGATGLAKDPATIVDLSPIIYEAEKRRVFSVGVGDHGNELGFGRIHKEVKNIMPHGQKCQCPCAAGMATVVKTDVVIPAFISNWGCYGIAAMIAFLLKRPDLCHTPEEEKRIVLACLNAGGLESHYCTRRFMVDGARAECGMAAVELLNEMVRLNLADPDTGPAH